MGRQMSFYLHPDDYQEFEDLLKATGDIILLPYYHFHGKVETVDTTIPTDLRKEGTRIYLVRQQDFYQVKLTHIEKYGYWLVADNDLPVLHYDRCNFDNNKLFRGRLYFQPSFIKDVQWVNKSVEFVTWSDNVIKTARRKLKRYKFDMGGWGFSEYVGQHAKKWLDNTKQEKQIDDSTLVTI
ncbi:MAG: hypothetical protein WBP58_07590 [Chitinophagaceae bacterium]